MFSSHFLWFILFAHSRFSGAGSSLSLLRLENFFSYVCEFSFSFCDSSSSPWNMADGPASNLPTADDSDVFALLMAEWFSGDGNEKTMKSINLIVYGAWQKGKRSAFMLRLMLVYALEQQKRKTEISHEFFTQIATEKSSSLPSWGGKLLWHNRNVKHFYRIFIPSEFTLCI